MNVDVKRAMREIAATTPPPPMDWGGYTTVLGQIQTPGSPITLGQRFWPFKIVAGYGPETEGAAGLFTVDGAATLYAVNLGSKNPIGGDIVIMHNVGGYWFFEYHGRLATE